MLRTWYNLCHINKTKDNTRHWSLVHLASGPGTTDCSETTQMDPGVTRQGQLGDSWSPQVSHSLITSG